MIINKVRLQHFCKFTEFETELNNDLALISGKNETGKSTIRNFIMWVLTDKFPDGSSATNIRPHDADGVDKDFLEVGGDMWVTCDDGKQYKLYDPQNMDGSVSTAQQLGEQVVHKIQNEANGNQGLQNLFTPIRKKQIRFCPDRTEDDSCQHQKDAPQHI